MTGVTSITLTDSTRECRARGVDLRDTLVSSMCITEITTIQTTIC